MTDLLHTVAGLFLASFVAIISIANPMSAMPVFTALTKKNTQEERAAIAKKTVIYMIIILVVFLLAGTSIQSFFGITLEGIRVAGGLIILQAALKMLQPSGSSKPISDQGTRAAQDKSDISFTPLAMPMMAGPGSISVVIGMASQTTTIIDFVVIIAAIVLSAVVSYFVLMLGPVSTRYIGASGMEAVTKMMGLIVMAIAMQFILSGIKDFFMV